MCWRKGLSRCFFTKRFEARTTPTVFLTIMIGMEKVIQSQVNTDVEVVAQTYEYHTPQRYNN